MNRTKSLVLVVDDIESNIEFVNDVITAEDIDVIGATTGAESLELAVQKKPDLILLDISMPQMDGYDVCKKLKEIPETADIPVLFLTARVQKEDIIKGFEVGAVDYILKPFNFKELISRVRTHLDLKLKTEQLKEINILLEEKVKERTNQLVLANKELKEANDKLEIAFDELSKLDKSKNEFINHINHELRTPINGILGYTSLLASMDCNAEETEYIEAINTLTKRLIKLSELSLIFTEIRVNDYNFELEKIDLKEVLNSSVNTADVSEKKINIQINNIQTNTYVKADSKLLSTCFSIILDNAIKYSDENSTIIITGKYTDNSCTIEISDNGPGFSDKAKKQLYKLFSADNLNYNTYGFGIGLATAKSILEVLKGKMQVSNNKDKGARVDLTFPRC